MTTSLSAASNLAFLGMNAQHWGYLIALLVMNLFILWVLVNTKLSLTLRETVESKDPEAVEARTKAIEAHADATVKIVDGKTAAIRQLERLSKGGQAVIQSLVEDLPGQEALLSDLKDAAAPAPLPISYSRVTGVLGAMVLTAAFWAFANFAVWSAFWSPSSLQTVSDAMGEFFLAGSALFAPYAFNQLAGIFRGKSG